VTLDTIYLDSALGCAKSSKILINISLGLRLIPAAWRIYSTSILSRSRAHGPPLIPTVMKRDSPCEPTSEGITQEKKPRLNEAGIMESDTTLATTGATSSEIQVTSAVTDSPVTDNVQAEPNESVANDPEDSAPSSSKRKNKSRGSRGRGRGRDQRARADRNEERKKTWASRGTRDGEEQSIDDGQEKAPRLPKRKVAVLLGFCGTGEC
jgi:hypothetical protein